MARQQNRFSSGGIRKSLFLKRLPFSGVSRGSAFETAVSKIYVISCGSRCFSANLVQSFPGFGEPLELPFRFALLVLALQVWEFVITSGLGVGRHRSRVHVFLDQGFPYQGRGGLGALRPPLPLPSPQKHLVLASDQHRGTSLAQGTRHTL
jgi:hypothetical protein